MIRRFLTTAVFVCVAAGGVMPDEVLTSVSIDTWGLMSAGKAAYLDYHYATSTLFWAEVALVDLKTKAKTVEVPNGTGAAYPYYIDYGYFKNSLAWIPYDVGGSGGGGGYGGGRTTYLYYKNISTGASRQLISNNAWKQMVWVGGDVVTWVDYRNWDSTTIDSLNSEIYMYNLAASQERRITADHLYQEKPYTDGQRIVWIEYSPTYGKLYQHTISSGTTAEVAPFAAGKDNPRIDGNTVVWEDYRNAGSDNKNADIYLYDIASGAVQPVCTATKYQGNPFAAGGMVVWEDYRNATAADSTNSDIYGYNIYTGTEAALVSGAGYQGHPTLLGDTLCWVDYSGGSMRLMTKVLAGTGVPLGKENEARRPVKLMGIDGGRMLLHYGDAAQRLTIGVMDVAGKRISEKNIMTSASGDAQIGPEAGWTSGTYIVSIRPESGRAITRACVLTR
jgi:hypothetical protein